MLKLLFHYMTDWELSDSKSSALKVLFCKRVLRSLKESTIFSWAPFLPSLPYRSAMWTVIVVVTFLS